MDTGLKNKFNYTATVVFLSIVSLISGIYSIVLSQTGFLVLPITASFLACTFVFEKKHISSLTISVILILTDVCTCFFITHSFSSTFSVVIAILIAVWYKKGYRKSEAVFIVTAITTIMLIVLLVLILVDAYGVNSISSLIDSINIEFAKLKNLVFISLSNAQQANPDMESELLNDEIISELFNLLYESIPALLIIFAFLLTGLTFKIFGGMILRYSSNEQEIMRWRFITTPIFAYFYLTVLILSFIITTEGGLFTRALINLELVFMSVFAYIGYTFTSALLTVRTGRPSQASLLIILAIFAFSSLAFRILAITGAIVVIIHGKLSNNQNSDFIFTNDKSNKK